jgi:integrase
VLSRWILHKGFRDAVRKKLIASNPAEAATAPASKAARAPEAKIWTPAELGVFLEWAAAEDDYYRPLWWTIAFTGLRRAEACGLEWGDVDLETGVLVVERTWNQWSDDCFEGEGKSDRARRVIDLDDATVAVLRGWRRRQSEMRLMVGIGWRTTNKVFTSPAGDALRPDTVTQAWRRTVRRSGLPTIRLHDLRHSHATHQLAVRANHREVADRRACRRRLHHADLRPHSAGRATRQRRSGRGPDPRRDRSCYQSRYQLSRGGFRRQRLRAVCAGHGGGLPERGLGRDRTSDLRIMSPLLSPLSYEPALAT